MVFSVNHPPPSQLSSAETRRSLSGFLGVLRQGDIDDGDEAHAVAQDAAQPVGVSAAQNLQQVSLLEAQVSRLGGQVVTQGPDLPGKQSTSSKKLWAKRSRHGETPEGRTEGVAAQRGCDVTRYDTTAPKNQRKLLSRNHLVWSIWRMCKRFSRKGFSHYFVLTMNKHYVYCFIKRCYTKDLALKPGLYYSIPR